MGREMVTQSNLSFQLLGPLRVLRGEREVPVPAAKLRILLASMLLRANQTVSMDELAAYLWGENPPEGAHTTLRSYVMRLRRILSPSSDERLEPIRTLPGGYLMTADDSQLDLLRFRSTLTMAQRMAADRDHRRESALLREALGLWRGPALSNVPSDVLHRDFVPGLTERRYCALEQRIDLDLERGAHREVVVELRDEVRTCPWREHFWAQLMLALYRQGRQAEALDAFRQVSERLRGELGIAVGSELRLLHQQILTNDPTLNLPLRSTSTTLAAKARVAVPDELPPDTGDFIGRQEELSQLRDLLSQRVSRTTVCVVDGLAGIGKTAFAVHLAHQLAPRFPDGQLFVDLRGFAQPKRPVEPATALELVLRSLSVPGSEIPPHEGARAALFRSLTRDRRMLLVLDDAADEAQVQPLLPTAPGCRVIVTSRRRLARLDQARLLTLDVLDQAEAAQLLTAVVGPHRIEAEPVQLVESVVHHCGHLPLAVKLAGAWLRGHPGRSLNQLAERLSSGHSIDAYGVAPSLQLSYLRLSVPQRRMLRVLGLRQVPDIDVQTAATLAGVTPREAETYMESLADANLLQEPVPGRYFLHNLVRAFAAGQTA
ncbi:MULTISPECIES: BTAD domain-containing putative transcriptional regulator [unclassified Streptomyces]|uniref:AfsR/SARP family transcriptional regulator n=2 Tax=unclassified Streptomyces TaxID=2593676 RepID=UPI002B1D671B|nr:BTAD domain-containing putative transcriptional regulator [Streptomyces sp. NBC_01306]